MPRPLRNKLEGQPIKKNLPTRNQDNNTYFINAEITEIRLDGQIDEQTTQFILDTDSRYNFIEDKFAQNLSKKKLSEPFKAKGADGSEVLIEEKLEVSVEFVQLPGH